MGLAALRAEGLRCALFGLVGAARRESCAARFSGWWALRAFRIGWRYAPRELRCAHASFECASLRFARELALREGALPRDVELVAAALAFYKHEEARVSVRRASARSALHVQSESARRIRAEVARLSAKGPLVLDSGRRKAKRVGLVEYQSVTEDPQGTGRICSA